MARLQEALRLEKARSERREAGEEEEAAAAAAAGAEEAEEQDAEGGDDEEEAEEGEEAADDGATTIRSRIVREITRAARRRRGRPTKSPSESPWRMRVVPAGRQAAAPHNNNMIGRYDRAAHTRMLGS